ncbi:MAG: hypothetical protein KatS3mg105_4675 [Gemmatales bacterium]|nr:MAG: hypothetical protein KatS3mg105_4675 [Gemmatales bacterium]
MLQTPTMALLHRSAAALPENIDPRIQHQMRFHSISLAYSYLGLVTRLSNPVARSCKSRPKGVVGSTTSRRSRISSRMKRSWYSTVPAFSVFTALLRRL